MYVCKILLSNNFRRTGLKLAGEYLYTDIDRKYVSKIALYLFWQVIKIDIKISASDEQSASDRY